MQSMATSGFAGGGLATGIPQCLELFFLQQAIPGGLSMSGEKIRKVACGA